MTFKALTIVAALMTIPGAAIARSCNHDDIAVTCQSGTVWDHASNRCVPIASS